MSSLTPEEARAIGAAATWQGPESDSEHRILANARRVRPFNPPVFNEDFACGYLAGDRDGFKRGVEAAMATICPCSLRTCVDLRAKIRALLAQEEQRG